mmetsp:Transcript_21520/g.44287  ORF Transcript_21520/g.44287 Transcript_21520/m.44287 type:complete len:705 (+) Transcript_21520:260-2374(+)
MPPKKQSVHLKGARMAKKLKGGASTSTKERKRRDWEAMADFFKEHSALLRNPKGRVRSLDENKIVMLMLARELEVALDKAKSEGDDYGSGITLHQLFESTAAAAHMRSKEVRRLYEAFVDEETGGTLKSLEPVCDNSKRGKGSDKAKPSSKIPNSVRLHLIHYIDKKHEKGRKVSRRELLNWLRKKHDVNCSKMALSRAMLDLGLSYKPSKPKARNNNVARLDQIRDYLIDLHSLLKKEKDGEVVLLYIDESYCNTNHSDTHSWHLSTGTGTRNKSTSKGRRLIFLHCITKDGPLVDIDPATGRPVDELDWKRDTPHIRRPASTSTTDQSAAADGPPSLLSTELIWLSDSSTGDYHDNMNGEMFMQWIVTRVIPTAQKMYPGKKIVPVMDNAPYHHVRGIPSLASCTKKQMVEIMKEHDIDYILLPMTDERKGLLPEQHAYTVENDHIRVPFNEAQFNSRKTKTNALHTPAADELKVAIVQWFKKHKPDILRCKVEMAIEEAGGQVLWTPPYCPDVQPIELYWAAGKGNVSRNYYHGRKVKATIEDLRDGWYGNKYKDANGAWYLRTPEDEDPDLVEEIKPADCGALVRHAIKCANDRVAKIPGLSGAVDGELLVDPEYRRVEVAATDIPIDTLVNTALAVEDFDDEDGDGDGGDDESDLMDLGGEIGDFEVDDTSTMDDVALLEVFSDDEDEEDEEDGVMAPV